MLQVKLYPLICPLLPLKRIINQKEKKKSKELLMNQNQFKKKRKKV